MTHRFKQAWLIFVCLGAACSSPQPPPSKSTSTAAPPARSGAPTPKAAPAPERAVPAPIRVAPKPAPVAPAEAAPTGGTLRIDSDVPGAQVFIDRQYVGVTPITAPNVPPGAHQVNVSAQGYTGIAQSVDVEPGPRDLMFRFKEVRLDAGIDVVHKHRMGSCKGRLVATPDGIRYETADKNDGFSAPLADLERFDVDYLAKTLHLKLAKGKQYDFTDPEGNADHLFVFHRDVDGAKKKLSDKP
jgi:PEGA domain